MNDQSDSVFAQRVTRLQGHLEADPDNPYLLSQVADLFLRMGNHREARPAVERLLALNPDDGATRYLVASLLFQEGRYEECLERTRGILDAGETHPAVRFQCARALAHLGRFEEAEPMLATLVAEDSSIRGVPHLYIRTLHHLGKFDEAIEYAGAQMRRRPEDSVTAGMLGLLYLDDDRLVEAALMAEQALIASPGNLDANVTLGFVSLGFGKVPKADVYFERALQLDPGCGRARLGRALIAMLDGDLVGGRAGLEQAVECMPLHLGTWNALAWVQILQGDDEAAMRTLQHCLRIDRRFGETYGALAVVAARQGRWDDVPRLADRAVRLDPEGFGGRFARSLLVAHRGDPRQGQVMVENMLKAAVMPGGGRLDDMVRRFSAAQKKQAVQQRLESTLPDGSPHSLH